MYNCVFNNMNKLFIFLLSLILSNLYFLIHTPTTTHPALFISELSRVVKLIGKRKLEPGQLTDLVFGLFQLAQKVGVLYGEFLLGGVVVVEGSVDFIQLRVDLVELML